MYKVKITYKSGHSEIVRCKKFTIKYKPGELTSLEWDNMIPKPYYINIDAIESIYQLPRFNFFGIVIY